MRFRPASLLNHAKRVEYAFGNLNVRFTKLTFLKHRFLNATSSNEKSVLFVKDTRPVPLYAGPSSPAFLKHLYPDATIGNTRAASLLSRDARLAFRGRDVRAAFMSPVSQNPASQLCEARRTLAS